MYTKHKFGSNLLYRLYTSFIRVPATPGVQFKAIKKTVKYLLLHKRRLLKYVP